MFIENNNTSPDLISAYSQPNTNNLPSIIANAPAEFSKTFNKWPYLLEAVVVNTKDAVLITEAEPVDLPGPRIVYANPAFCNMTGYSLEEVLGRTPRILQGPQTNRQALDKIRTALKNWESIRIELLNYQKNGTQFWVELSIVPVADETGWFHYWISVQRDITKRKLKELALQTLIENSTDCIVIVDGNGVITYATPSVNQFFGLESPLLIGQALFSYVDLKDAEKLRQVIDRVNRHPDIAMPFEFKVQNKLTSSWMYFEAAASNKLGDENHSNVVLNLKDITQQKIQSDRLQLLEKAVAASSNGIIITDATLPDNPIIYVSPGFEKVTGYSASEVIGLNCRFLQGADTNQPVRYDLRKNLLEDEESRIEIRNYRKDGTLFWNELHISPIRNAEGKVTNYVGVQNDITTRKTVEEQMAHLAFHDSLTQLPNRALFLHSLERALLKRSKDERFVGVLFFDLDRFKIVNDSLGHEVGDQLLKAVGERLRNQARQYDLVSRLGGDEFTILMEDLTDPLEATVVASRVLEAMSIPFQLAGREVFVTTSIGIALANTGDISPTTLMRKVDVALYQAKNKGKARFEIYDEALNLRALERLELEGQLGRALERGEFVLYYQPKFRLDTGAIIGMEALVRWNNPGRGLVYPSEFIPIAEETGLIRPLGRWVLEQACLQANLWNQHFKGEFPMVMSVNLSARQLQQVDLVNQVANILAQTSLPANLLQLEITESVVMEDAELNTATLNQLKQLGVQLAIDDFGTGYSSLSYLKRFPVDCLKIDRSFVMGLDQDPAQECIAIVQAVVSLSEALKVEVIAEGVETEQQAEQLLALGCNFGQGYYYSKPLSAEQVEQLLRNAPGCS